MIAFILYIPILIYTTFFGARTTLYGMSIWDYAVRMANLKPFKTISMYTKMLKDPSNQMFSVALVNLSVNLVLLFPLAYLIPALFSKLRNIFATIGVCIGALVVIELMQLFTRRGSFDVDDFILNMIGALIGFGCWKLQYVIGKKKKGKSIFDED
ncbi:MAG: VanZ family protein [Lachnospiraceae bacterium]|nr:VanZ family protein [Lachnospiraceae bacterium]MBP5565319.1 VanZ family protein [Lachnospiraceae bacterium]